MTFLTRISKNRLKKLMKTHSMISSKI